MLPRSCSMSDSRHSGGGVGYSPAAPGVLRLHSNNDPGLLVAYLLMVLMSAAKNRVGLLKSILSLGSFLSLLGVPCSFAFLAKVSTLVMQDFMAQNTQLLADSYHRGPVSSPVDSLSDLLTALIASEKN